MSVDTTKTGSAEEFSYFAAVFLLYIKDLKAVLPKGVEVALFAVDFSLFCCHP